MASLRLGIVERFKPYGLLKSATLTHGDIAIGTLKETDQATCKICGLPKVSGISLEIASLHLSG
jgi:hypothetical protein